MGSVHKLEPGNNAPGYLMRAVSWAMNAWAHVPADEQAISLNHGENFIRRYAPALEELSMREGVAIALLLICAAYNQNTPEDLR